MFLLKLLNSYFQTFEWTKEVANKSISAKNDALNLFNDVNNLQVPEVNIPDLQKKSDGLRVEAYQLGNESLQINQNGENSRKLAEEKVMLGRELLDDAYAQQDSTDELLNEIYDVKDRADTAINNWNTMLNETESIYKDLKG